MAGKSIHLVIIDPQNDFCDLPSDYCPALPGKPHEYETPALPVSGAHADMQRLATLIDQGGDGLTAITVTLDSHHRVDIAHPPFWLTSDGAAVAPFTQIRAADVCNGRFRPRDKAAAPRVLAYLEVLEANGRYVHMVWPVHCEIGTWGNNVHADVRHAYNRWEEKFGRVVGKLIKGTNPWTEHYSAIKAEVPLDDDPATQLNTAFIEQLKMADTILIAGEAGSHCVKATVEHIVENFPAAEAGKLVLLTDCMSPVSGFESEYESFIDAMRLRGVRIARSSDVLPELLANAAG
ncbi:cysteine hydrolase [Propionivibrio limicola]|uniref:cysteine hydrolase n=1 Tax=Propionivibrio limicola TaxID=167645 RepID=UPI00129142F7|nr:cysteine hydrolase [Propionivibrio limicola]